MIRAGALGLLGLNLGRLGSVEAAAGNSSPKAKSVIFIFLSGGLSQIDTLDMKPEASLEIRGEFSPISTRTPGLQICEHLPMLAQRSDRWALCRSISHSSNEHSHGHHIMLTGKSDLPLGFNPGKPMPSDWPSMAALVNHALEPGKTLPPSMVLPEKIVHRTGRKLPGQFAGMLGRQNEPFFVETSRYNATSYGAYPDFLFHHAGGQVDGSKMQFRELELSLPHGLTLDRLRDRVALSKHLDVQSAHLERAADQAGMTRYDRMAASLLADPKTRDAFNVHGADPKLQEKYGKNVFGWSLLMARQLVESGVRLVQVNLGNNEAWDTHQAAFPNLKNFLLPPTDQAVSALLDDLRDRGMLEDTLVVMASEFGRTPTISTLRGAKLPGRDHWGAVQTALFAGAGVTGGAVVGSSDATGGHPASDPKTPEDFAATIYHALGIPRDAIWYDLSGRPHFYYHGNEISFG